MARRLSALPTTITLALHLLLLLWIAPCGCEGRRRRAEGPERYNALLDRTATQQEQPARPQLNPEVSATLDIFMRAVKCITTQYGAMAGGPLAYIIRNDVSQEEADERITLAWECIRTLRGVPTHVHNKLEGIALPTAMLQEPQHYAAPDPQEQLQTAAPYAMRCLGGQRILALGNSVTRGWVFALESFLSQGTQQSAADRRAEIALCGKGGGYGKKVFDDGREESCHGPCGCMITIQNTAATDALHQNVSIEFYHQQQYYSTDMRDLLLSGPYNPDIIMLNAGLDDMTHWKAKDRKGINPFDPWLVALTRDLSSLIELIQVYRRSHPRQGEAQGRRQGPAWSTECAPTEASLCFPQSKRGSFSGKRHRCVSQTGTTLGPPRRK